ncbi:malonic semialdehyde reductase [Actinacidiphila reveromycinica]|uniref:malonic semialdehyde reductase n=1 Tax=Actinacidiphila reveromycinica TaxID=659352 RepID=UPI001EFF9973|nr:malonic semialdehyde reductase [Streptomyces sp. SN-593]
MTGVTEDARKQLFRAARTAKAFTDTPVGDDELREIWELTRWGPTGGNIQPLRVLFVRGEEAVDRLVPHLSKGNARKVRAAPATAVLAADLDFHSRLGLIAPGSSAKQERYAADRVLGEADARFNATLQAGYFVMAVRAVGLAAGPMGGFDGPGIDAEFFGDRNWRTILAVNIGHPAADAWQDRQPRVPEADAVHWA